MPSVVKPLCATVIGAGPAGVALVGRLLDTFLLESKDIVNGHGATAINDSTIPSSMTPKAIDLTNPSDSTHLVSPVDLASLDDDPSNLSNSTKTSKAMRPDGPNKAPDLQLEARVHWIDEAFSGGRLKRYSTVPSNTKVRLFAEYGRAFESFVRLADHQSPPSWPDIWRTMDPEVGCALRHPHAMLLQLTDALTKHKQVQKTQGVVRALIHDGQLWHVHTQLPDGSLIQSLSARVFLAIGAQPREPAIYASCFPKAKSIRLEDALDVAQLQRHLSANDVVAVVGSSHSAMLAIMNVVAAAKDVSIKHFVRHPLKYARAMPAEPGGEPWILHDNTGLKGLVADWSHAMCLDSPDACKLPQYSRVSLQSADGLLERELELLRLHGKAITKYILAIGYEPSVLPAMAVQGCRVQQLFCDPSSAQLSFGPLGEPCSLEALLTSPLPLPKVSILSPDDCSSTSKHLTALPLFGYGIAFPERVIDPLGNVELAVGMKKFINYIKRTSKNFEALFHVFPSTPLVQHQKASLRLASPLAPSLSRPVHTLPHPSS